jgi:hypothetical protein
MPYAPTVLRFLPYAYAGLWVAELIALVVIYVRWHPAASSTFGTALGWAGLVSMIVMLVYSIARRSRSMRQWARLSHWLHFHIFLGFQGVLFVAFHSSSLWSKGFLNPLNPGFLSFVGATIVFCSGLFGRFLFGRLPRGPDGEPNRSQRVFGLWIVLHRPLAAAMYLVTFVHVALSYMFTPSLAGP